MTMTNPADPANAEHGRSEQDWRAQVRKDLFGLEAPRVVRNRDIAMMAKSAGMAMGLNAAAVAVSRLVLDLEARGVLRRVHKGLYLNQVASPRPEAAEAAPFIRAGALVSLQTVLGNAGVLNNFTAGLVTCVLPRQRNSGAQPVELAFEGGSYWFRSVPSQILCAGDEDDRTTLSRSWQATPEAALIHWLWLASEDAMPAPPSELDLDTLDIGRLERLAEETGLQDPAQAMLEAARRYAADEDVMDNGVSTMGF